MKASCLALIATLLLAGCGAYKLSGGAIPLSNKTQDQIQLDVLTCQDQAKLAANTAERQAGAFLLGMTIVGVPAAFEIEKAKTREVYKSCMEARGYRVLPLKEDAVASETTSPAALTQPLAPTPPSFDGLTAAERMGGRTAEPSTAAPHATPQRDDVTQFQKLKELHDKGLISTEEYDRKRKEFLDKL